MNGDHLFDPDDRGACVDCWDDEHPDEPFPEDWPVELCLRHAAEAKADHLIERAREEGW